MLNHATFQGRLTHTPELKTSQSGKKFLKGSIACERNFKNPAGERDTDFFNFSAWGSTAEYISKFFVKGQLLLLSGRMQSGTYTNKKGEKRTFCDLVVESANFCGALADKKEMPEAATDSYEEPPLPDDSDSPFGDYDYTDV